MDKLKKTVAKNIATLRVVNNFTQAELGEKINYSDKAVSKWERGESLPDIYVLKQISDIFNVSVDDLISEHNEDPKKSVIKNRYRTITQLSVLGIYTIALLLFIIFWLFDITAWQIFIYAVPVSMIILIVENSIWGKAIWNFFYISGLVWGLIASLYVALLERNWWMFFLLGIPAELIIFLGFRLKPSKKKWK